MDTPLTVRDVTYERLAKTIDHSLLRPELTLAEVREGCELAARYDVASVCVRPADVVIAAEPLRGTAVAVGTVVGFPHGAHRTGTKVFEAERAMADGATELDMVINIGWLRSGEDDRVREDLYRLRAGRGDDRGPPADAMRRLGAGPREGSRWRANARRAARGDLGRRRPHRRDADGCDPGRLPGPNHRLSAFAGEGLPLGGVAGGERRADRAGRRAELGRRDFDVLGRHQGDATADRVADRGHHELAGRRDPAADHDPPGPDPRDEVRQRDAEVAGHGLDRRDAALVPVSNAAIDLLGGGPFCELGQRVGLDQRLDAAAVAAPAERAVGQHGLVADLAGPAPFAELDQPVDHGVGAALGPRRRGGGRDDARFALRLLEHDRLHVRAAQVEAHESTKSH